MTTSLDRAISDIEKLNSDASFAELQIHDKLKVNLGYVNALKCPSTFNGYLSCHGEGETDGKRRIKFSSNDETERKRYVQESVDLYLLILNSFETKKVRRLILHPDTLSRKVGRKDQIISLARSLLEIRDRLKHKIEFVCIEPRGGTRHNKVLRAEIEDIETLQDYLGQKTAKDIGLCIDIAQLYVVHGNRDMSNFLDRLHRIRTVIKQLTELPWK